MYRLTEREKQVLNTMIEHKAYTLDKICKILYIEKSTAQTHLKNIYEKWDVHSKAEMIAYFYKQKLNENLICKRKLEKILEIINEVKK